jgi:hypothetical protein
MHNGMPAVLPQGMRPSQCAASADVLLLLLMVAFNALICHWFTCHPAGCL